MNLEEKNQDGILSESDSWIDRARDGLAELFLQKRRPEFEKFVADETERGRIASLFRTLTDRVDSMIQRNAVLSASLGRYKDADLSLSIYRNWLANTTPVEHIASEPVIVQAFILREHGPRILELANAEMSGVKAELETFKKENRKTLVELNLI